MSSKLHNMYAKNEPITAYLTVKLLDSCLESDTIAVAFWVFALLTLLMFWEDTLKQ